MSVDLDDLTRPAYEPPVQDPLVVTVWSPKGGEGKSTIAFNIAALMNAVIADCEWDGGGISATWGYDENERVGAPLLDAIEKKRTPKPLSGRGIKPELIPGHSSFVFNQPEPEEFAPTLVEWSKELKRVLVVDTHPGGGKAAFGAMSAAKVILVPFTFGSAEFRSLNKMLDETSGYPIMLVPNKYRNATEDERAQLKEWVADYSISVAKPIRYYDWLKRLKRRTPPVLGAPSKARQPFRDDMNNLHQAVIDYVA